MIGGICLQTVILIVVTALTNWKKEVSSAQLLSTLAENCTKFMKIFKKWHLIILQ